MKYYDKKMYEIEEKIRIELFILLIFIISFLLGVFITHTEISYKDHQIIKQLQIEIDNLRTEKS